jgi:hypothetical protein
MAYPNSAAAQAAAIRQHARRGVWRRLTAAVGLNPSAVRADAQAALWARGAAGEQATAARLAPLTAQGWHLRHDLALPRSRANLDHLLISPCGTGAVVLDTKAWHRGRPTHLVGGRVHCGAEDRHGQVEKVAGYAARVREALGMPGVEVLPLLVVHGSPVAGGHLDVRVEGWPLPVYVLAPDWLSSTLGHVGRRAVADPRAAAVLARRVDSVLLPYARR